MGTNTEVDANRWHKRLGHISARGLKELEKRKSVGDKFVNGMTFCDDFKISNEKKVLLFLARYKKDNILEYMTIGLYGPEVIPSIGGSKYILSIINVYSRMLWVYLMKSRDEVLN